MTAWVILSTHWGLSSVQASLNVIISVLGTVGIWSFSRYWYRRGSSNILSGEKDVPLPALFTFTSPGDAWDLVAVLRTRVLAKENWYLLVQLIVVIAVTAACMLSGPIAKVSLRNSRAIQRKDLQVLQTTKGGGFLGNLLYANVVWNETIQSLDRAGFPTNQLLDYLPPITEPWTYIEDEWDPTWRVACNNTHEIIIPNVTATGNYSIYDPLNAFPAFRDTYDPSWLNKTKYRVENNFDSWAYWPDQTQLKHVLFYVLIQSDPVIGNRMYTNNDTLEISLTIFNTRDFSAQYTDPGISGETTWRPIGTVRNASYARTECSISRKPEVADEEMIPWLWTNDTYSITMGYRTYWEYWLHTIGRAHTDAMPTPEDIFRFYQVYMIATNTNHPIKSTRKVSVWVDTVELSVVFLVATILLTLMILWSTGRYLFFLGRHKSKIEQMYVPDGKIEWMIHAAKSSDNGIEEALIEGTKFKDRDHFRAALFGQTTLATSDAGLKSPGIARVHTNRSSITGSVPTVKIFGTDINWTPTKSTSTAAPSTVEEKHDVVDTTSVEDHDVEDTVSMENDDDDACSLNTESSSIRSESTAGVSPTRKG